MELIVFGAVLKQKKQLSVKNTKLLYPDEGKSLKHKETNTVFTKVILTDEEMKNDFIEIEGGINNETTI